MNAAPIVQYWNFRFARRERAMRERAESPVSWIVSSRGGVRRPNHRLRMTRKALVNAFGMDLPQKAASFAQPPRRALICRLLIRDNPFPTPAQRP